MPSVHEHDPIYSQQYLRQFYFKFSQKKIVMGRKIVVPSLDVTMIAFFPKNIHWSSLFAQKVCVNTEWVRPGHPIILLISNKFNMAMATVSVKKSTCSAIYTPLAMFIQPPEAGLEMCSCGTWWPLAPYFCSRGTWKSHFWHRNHMQDILNFTGCELLIP